MAEPFSAAGVAGLTSSKLLTVLLGFVGAVITLSYMPELTKRQWLSSVLFGVVAAYIAPPSVVALIHHTGIATWLPADGSVEGLSGLLLGMGSIHIIAGFTLIGRRFGKNPLSFFRRGKWEQSK